MGFKTAISDFQKFENIENVDTFSTFFYFCKKSPQIWKFSKTGKHILEKPLKYVCTKLQVIALINVVCIAFWMLKMAAFQGILT